MTNEEVIELEATCEIDGERIDSALSAVSEELSRSYVQKLIESGKVTVNGKVCLSKKQKVCTGDRITLIFPPPKEIDVKPEQIPLQIAYEDEDVLVIDKPKGMVVHPAPGNESGTLVNAVLYYCEAGLSTINGVIRPGIVHRIDKDTSGLIMVAKNDVAHRSLAAQLASHTIVRAYSAIVYDNITADEGTIDAPIGRDPRNRLRQAVTDVNARNAITHYKVLERFGKFTFIEARLETGRTHQIRVHMSYIRHPLLGDQVYGPKKKVLGVETQMLHANLLGFTHPRSGEYIELESPLPEEFSRVLKKLRAVK